VSDSLLLSMGVPRVLVVAFPIVLVLIRGVLWARNQLKRQPSRAEAMKTLLELFPEEGTATTDIKQRVNWRAGLHEFDTQTRPSVAHPLVVITLGLFLMVGWLLAVICLSLALLLAAVGHYSDFAVALLYGVVFAVSAFLTHGFDEFDFRYTLMGERLDNDSKHLPEVRQLRRELGLIGRRDQQANWTYYLRKTFPRSFSRMRYNATIHRRARRIKRMTLARRQRNPRRSRTMATKGPACPASSD